MLLWVAFVLLDSSRAGEIDLDDRCRPHEIGQCFTDELGQVESVGSDTVTVRHNDGRDTMTVTLAADSAPSPGQRVRLERWDGSVVSLYVPSRERRYHTIDWPRRFDPYVLWVGILGAIGILTWALPAAYAAISKGKP